MGKKICFFNTNIAWGGGEKWHFETARLLQSQGYEVMIYAAPRSELLNKSRKHKLACKAVKVSNLSFLNPVKLLLTALNFRRQAFGTIILNLPSDVKFAGQAAKIAGVKKIVYRRGTALPVSNSFLNRYLFRHVLTCLITNSEDIRQKLFTQNKSLISENKVKVVHNYLPASYQPLAPLPKSNQTIILGNAGRLVEQKGQIYLIQLARLLKKHRIDFQLKIAGTGKLEHELKQKSIEYGVSDRIIFEGFIDNMPYFLSNIDIFLFPSLHEGISNVLLEAMAHAKPTVAFNVSSMPEIITDGVNGCLAEFKNIEQFLDKTIQLVRDPDLAKRMGQSALKTVLKRFNQETFLKTILPLI